MKKTPTISLIVPCKNEAKILPEFMRKVPSIVTEVLIVDNNSTDDTALVAKQLGARVIRESKTKNGIGYGYAHMKGMKQANGEYLVAMDGDDTYPVSAIGQIIHAMEKQGLDFVSCTRLPLKNPEAISPLRQLGILFLNAQVRLLYGVRTADILTGMWVMKKEAADKLVLKEGDWNFSPEIKLAAIHHPKVRYGEYHIHHFVREHEISKQQIFKTGFSHVWYILKRRVTVDNDVISYLEGVIRYGALLKTRFQEGLATA